MVTDPTTAAREWLTANPDHEVAVHVRAALDSSDTYEVLARESADAPPGGTRVVILTIGEAGRVVITAPDRASEAWIAEIFTGYMEIVLSTAKDLAMNELCSRLAKRAATLAGRMARKKLGTPEEAHARGALEEVTRIRGWVEGKRK